MSLLNLNGELIDTRIMRAVSEMGFEQFTPIQEQAIPIMMDGKDLIGQAQTGTGKTAAFGIPLLQAIDPEVEALQGLILCPTRELAIQAAEELRKFAKYISGVRVLPVYGGQDITRQIRSLKSGVQIVVGTPGRVMDHMRRHTIKLENLTTVVLDEADEMLNMGFREDMETILSQIPGEHQTALFSATMPQAILDITGQFQNNPVLIKTIQKELTVPSIKQYYYEVRRENKREAVARLLDYYNPKRTLIFCNTKKMVEELAEHLKGRGYFAEGLHGDLSQAMRDRVMSSFRNGTCDVLIATDVAARGIDVGDVEAVINFDVPQEIEYYVHRIGRTGRAGRDGRSFTLVVGREIYRIRDIERSCKTKMKARALPTSADITHAKAVKVLGEVMGILRDKDLKDMTRMIEEKMEDEDCTAIELAAAFLKLHMGEELEDIPVEKYEPRRGRRERDGERRSGGRDRRGGDRRGGWGFRGREGRREDDRRRDDRGRDSRRGDDRRRVDPRRVGLLMDDVGRRDDRGREGRRMEDGRCKEDRRRKAGYDKDMEKRSGRKKGTIDLAVEILKKGKPKKLDKKGNPVY
ncbi:MAG: DEAD/DEAH box helicase [Lachnospiraceae bacterium]|nr:DEAD/DEAH box helicase [Lachnospiraceae bacterium]